MHILIPLLALLLLMSMPARGQRQAKDAYAVGFYNLENLFDTIHDAGKRDLDFTPDGRYGWTAERYSVKLSNMAGVIAEMGCAVMGVAEVENEACLKALVAQNPLAGRGLKFCHVEGPDARGIDAALLYDPQLFTPEDVRLEPFASDTAFVTRGFLVVSGKLAGVPLSIIVCHLPSRFNPSPYRESGAIQVRALKDSLLSALPGRGILVMGDMNDDPSDPSMAQYLRGKKDMAEVKNGDMFNPWWKVLEGGTGTLYYKGEWNLFDQILLSPSLLSDGADGHGGSSLHYAGHEVFSRPYMLHQEGDLEGSPLRTTLAPNAPGGFSDHLPTIIYLSIDPTNP